MSVCIINQSKPYFVNKAGQNISIYAGYSRTAIRYVSLRLSQLALERQLRYVFAPIGAYGTIDRKKEIFLTYMEFENIHLNKKKKN